MLLKQRNGPFTQDASTYSWVPNKRDGHARLLISESLSTLPAVFHIINGKFVHPPHCFSCNRLKNQPTRACPFIRHLRVDRMIGYWSFFSLQKKVIGTLNNWYWANTPMEFLPFLHMIFYIYIYYCHFNLKFEHCAFQRIRQRISNFIFKNLLI